MATHKSAIKRHRQSLIRKAKNKAVKTRMRNAVKSLLKAIESKETEGIPEKLKLATSIISKTETKGILKKNTAARKISRLTKRANTAVQAGA